MEKETIRAQFERINNEKEQVKQQEVSAYVEETKEKISANLENWMKSEHNFYTLFPEDEFGDVWRRGLGQHVNLEQEKNDIPEKLLTLYTDLKDQGMEVVIKKELSPIASKAKYGPYYCLELNLKKW
jgi:glutamate synthase domain-containing protein 3